MSLFTNSIFFLFETDCVITERVFLEKKKVNFIKQRAQDVVLK